jgi:hypothetical protein
MWKYLFWGATTVKQSDRRRQFLGFLNMNVRLQHTRFDGTQILQLHVRPVRTRVPGRIASLKKHDISFRKEKAPAASYRKPGWQNR